MNPRPLAVTIIGWIYILMGVVTFLYPFADLKGMNPSQPDFILVEGVRVVAVVSGVYLLRGHNWARWTALAWMAFHVVFSAFHSLSQSAVHGLFFAILIHFLFRPAASRFFEKARS